MKDFYEKVAGEYLELASHQRLEIIFKLQEKNQKLTELAKALNATSSEVFRNLGRLEKANIIKKKIDGRYELTTYGNTICSITPSFVMISKNKKYFSTHYFGDIPKKFIQRSGALIEGKYVDSYVKMLDMWKSININAEKYIYNVMSEVPYTEELIKPLSEKVEKGVEVKSVFSESSLTSDSRKELLKKFHLNEKIKNGLIERKMKKNVNVITLLNEKEACVMFPKTEGESDISKGFYSNNKYFHEWCLDYFRYAWNTAGAFKESKLNVER